MRQRVAKIIVFSDIHGNLPALRAAWQDIAQRPYDRLYCLGDLAAFGPFPEECVAFLRDEIKPDVTLLGNTDRYLLTLRDGKDAPLPSDPDALAALKWGADQLSDESVAWLRTLPAGHEETLGGLSIRLAHGIPGDDETGVGPATPVETLRETFGEDGEGMTFSGHTHIAFRTRIGAQTLINAGSIGLPFDGDFRACYVRGQLDGGIFHDFEHRRVPYSMEQTLTAIERRDLPDAERFSRRLRFSLAQ